MNENDENELNDDLLDSEMDVSEEEELDEDESESGVGESFHNDKLKNEGFDEDYLAGYSSSKKLMVDVIEDIERKYSQKYDNEHFIFTGFPHLVFKKGSLVVIGARAGIGLTAFSLSLVKKICIENKKPTGFITTGPMESLPVGKRLISIDSTVPMSKIRAGMLNIDDITKIQNSACKIYESPFLINDDPNASFEVLEQKIQAMVQAHKIEILFIDSFDYLDEVANPEKYGLFHDKKSMLEDYKRLAQKLNITIVMLKEIPVAEEGCSPDIKSLKKEMFIQRTANQIFMISRQFNCTEETKVEASLSCEKNDFGPTSIISIKFIPSTAEFLYEED